MKQKTIFMYALASLSFYPSLHATNFSTETKTETPALSIQVVESHALKQALEQQLLKQENSSDTPKDSTLRSRGPRGPRGIPGPQGKKGDTGPRGHRGKRGHKGDTGDTGPAGAPGETGPAGEQGPPGEAGAAGAPGEAGATGSITQNAISYYTSNYSCECEPDWSGCGECICTVQSYVNIGPGQVAISFNTENTTLGSSGAFDMNDSNIWFWVNGTFLFSITGIVQVVENESGVISYTVGLREQEGEAGPCELVNPYPLGEYSFNSSGESESLLSSTFSVLQMVKVNNAGAQPVSFQVLLNNLSGNNIRLLNPVLNIMQID